MQWPLLCFPLGVSPAPCALRLWNIPLPHFLLHRPACLHVHCREALAGAMKRKTKTKPSTGDLIKLCHIWIMIWLYHVISWKESRQRDKKWHKTWPSISQHFLMTPSFVTIAGWSFSATCCVNAGTPLWCIPSLDSRFPRVCECSGVWVCVFIHRVTWVSLRVRQMSNFCFINSYLQFGV